MHKKLKLLFAITAITQLLLCGCKEQIQKDDIWTYELSSDGSYYCLSRVELLSTTREVVIPSTYNGLPVKEIGTSAFVGQQGLEKVAIPEGILTIGQESFFNCGSLTEVTIPNSVNKIKSCAFSWCSNLIKITIGEGVCELERGVFTNSFALIDIVNYSSLDIKTYLSIDDNNSEIATVWDSATYKSKMYQDPNGFIFYIDDEINYLVACEHMCDKKNLVLPVDCKGEDYIIHKNAFHNYTYEAITIPKGCIDIEMGALEYTSIETITLKKDAKYLPRLFAQANQCKNLILEDGNEFYIFEDGILYNEDKTVLLKSVGKQKKFIIPPEVKSIYDCAFLSNKFLNTLSMSDSVVSIGTMAFDDCTYLKNVVLSKNLEFVGDLAFYMDEMIQTTTYDNAKYFGSSNNPYFYLFSGTNPNIVSCRVHDDCKIIGHGAFWDFWELNEVTNTDNIRQIGSSAFHGTSLKEFVVPYSVTCIETDTFDWCRDLTITLHDHLNYIGDYVFDVKKVNFNNNDFSHLKYLGSSVFNFDNKIVDLSELEYIKGGILQNGKTFLLGTSLKELDHHCLVFDPKYQEESINIIFAGTIEEWDNVKKPLDFCAFQNEYGILVHDFSPIEFSIVCTDGIVTGLSKTIDYPYTITK